LLKIVDKIVRGSVKGDEAKHSTVEAEKARLAAEVVEKAEK
jgi:hypothetical protein